MDVYSARERDVEKATLKFQLNAKKAKKNIKLNLSQHKRAWKFFCSGKGIRRTAHRT